MNHFFAPDLSRRQLLKTLGAAASLAGFQVGMHQPAWAQSACSLLGSPSLTEGPYFVDEDLNRPDIRVDPTDGTMQEGLPLALSINVSQLVNCEAIPLTGSYVDIWHCNAAGVYSDVAAQNSTPKKYLRGYQPTDRHGNVYFVTVYPGWYPGRAVHIHVKVRTFAGDNKTYSFTSQFFCDDSFTDEVYKTGVYAKTRARDTRNTSDGIYSGPSATGAAIAKDSGSYLMLALRNKGTYVEGDAKLVCDLSLGSSPDQSGGGPGGPGGPGPGGPGPGGPGPGGPGPGGPPAGGLAD